ncbi:hypothetical protein LINPERPRIM_LOCUS18774, partial [Linum perenne]
RHKESKPYKSVFQCCSEKGFRSTSGKLLVSGAKPSSSIDFLFQILTLLSQQISQRLQTMFQRIPRFE